jgi:hypothetical protein
MYESKPPALVESTLILTLTITIVFDPKLTCSLFLSVIAFLLWNINKAVTRIVIRAAEGVELCGLYTNCNIAS